MGMSQPAMRANLSSGHLQPDIDGRFEAAKQHRSYLSAGRDLRAAPNDQRGHPMFKSFTNKLATPLAEALRAAPSLHNSQPWQLAVEGGELRLYGVPDRALWVSDPLGRGLFISCGAGLFNARIAARRLGYDLRVRLLPHPEHPLDVLAVIRAAPGQPPTAQECRLYQAIWQRQTNRLPYSAGVIPAEALAELRHAASAEGAALRFLDEPQTAQVLDLAQKAGRELADTEPHMDELRRRIKHRLEDDIPAGVLPLQPEHTPSPVRDSDFLAAVPGGPRATAAYERCPQLAVLSTEHDDPMDWLIAGQALQAVLLVATQSGLSASFLYQIMEGDDMRDPHPRSWPWPENVQTIIRLGYRTAEVPVTPRRSTADLLQSGEALRIG